MRDVLITLGYDIILDVLGASERNAHRKSSYIEITMIQCLSSKILRLVALN